MANGVAIAGGEMGTFRFLLAMSVTLGHFGTVWGYHIMNGRMAVQCFFMISGFLISLVLSQKYDPGTADGRALFYTNRALRFFVPYWSFCLMILLAHALIYTHPRYPVWRRCRVGAALA